MQESAKIFWQTSPDIYSIDNIAQSSFFHTLISLTIIVSHHYFPIQIVKFFLKFMNMFGKINLFCISICIMKHLNQKTQNNWFSTQIIVQGVRGPSTFWVLSWNFGEFWGTHKIGKNSWFGPPSFKMLTRALIIGVGRLYFHRVCV